MIAPIEIENKEFKKGLRGYKEDEVDEFLDLVKEDYIPETLKATLVRAEASAEDTTNAANKKAKIIVEEADLKAKQIIDQANNEVIEIRREYNSLVKEFKVFRNKFKSLLNDELQSIDEIFYNVDENHIELDNTIKYDLQNEVAVSSLD